MTNMKITMSGASGFVGTHLTRSLTLKGYEVVPIGEKDFSEGTEAIRRKTRGSGAIINLAGAPIIAKWTEEYRKVLYSSRIDTTSMLVDAVSGSGEQPEVFISTSAVGIYRNGGPHTESSCVYSNEFLGRLAADWENAASKAQAAGIRTVIYRFGIVLGADGGALSQMLPPFRLGLGGRIGSGKQPFSWVHIEDLISAYFFALENPEVSDTYNLTAPEASTNMSLTDTLAAVLNRPALFAVPEFVLRIRYGDGASVLVEGQDARPERLLASGFDFRFKTLREALENLLNPVYS